ncbi:hypothetical protein BU24DRAFT_265743 [Aaosphaeria arxii CBS 175.79]|uniref:Uncharacterized protein n=1 Tax=Aaosphaeria arxii CBS 175.79 TaxID=1450172 RepID=A0A6A5XFH7_9PLEO|nr:uncharacterized protein BU24DRAFT_265743 [Aaosphaeria arxii CBS 175.79]KAF2011888.1 hypothetical protein BU24DRAFT_265743 [Aaosphaeria arxii CBS 175.79]
MKNSMETYTCRSQYVPSISRYMNECVHTCRSAYLCFLLYLRTPTCIDHYVFRYIQHLQLTNVCTVYAMRATAPTPMQCTMRCDSDLGRGNAGAAGAFRADRPLHLASCILHRAACCVCICNNSHSK